MYIDGNTSPDSPQVDLTSYSLTAGQFFIICSDLSTFLTVYGIPCDVEGQPARSNGNDQIALLNDGMVYDLFGVIGEAGTGTAHEFTDGRAIRKTSATTPAQTWNANDWLVTTGSLNAPIDYDPKVWPVWENAPGIVFLFALRNFEQFYILIFDS